MSVNSGNPNSQDSHKNTYPDPVFNFGFTEPQYSEKCWSYFRLNYIIFTIGKTHTQDEHNYPILHVCALVRLFGTSYLVLVSQYKWHHHFPSDLKGQLFSYCTSWICFVWLDRSYHCCKYGFPHNTFFAGQKSFLSVKRQLKWWCYCKVTLPLKMFPEKNDIIQVVLVSEFLFRNFTFPWVCGPLQMLFLTDKIVLIFLGK